MKKLINKISFAILVALFAVTMGIFVQSCSNDDVSDPVSPISTRADLLVASSDFQKFQENIQNFAENLRTNYIKLSESDKNEFNEILKKTTEGNVENIEGAYEQMNSIIGIDLKSKLTEIRKNSFNERKSVEISEISRRDLMVAIKKQSIVREETIPRLKSGSEEGGNQKCKDACSVTYVGGALMCLLLPPPTDIGCGLILTVAYVACLDAC